MAERATTATLAITIPAIAPGEMVEGEGEVPETTFGWDLPVGRGFIELWDAVA